MQGLSDPVLEHPEVERAMHVSRVVGFSSWLVGLVVFGAACATRQAWLFAAFAAWYLVLAVIVAVVATKPRKRQKELDREWGQRFHALAIRDELTGLYNRRYFNSDLEAQFGTCRRQARPLSIAIVDLNDFKRINDTFGHHEGDVALRVAGQAILEAAPGDATVARIGGDEFAVIMPGKDRTEAEAVARGIRAAVEAARFVVQGGARRHGHIRATVGVAASGSASTDPRALLREADTSLYERKRAQRAA